MLRNASKMRYVLQYNANNMSLTIAYRSVFATDHGNSLAVRTTE